MKTAQFSLRWSGAAVATLALVLTGTVRAANAPLPFSEIGAKATADYQGETIGHHGHTRRGTVALRLPEAGRVRHTRRVVA